MTLTKITDADIGGLRVSSLPSRPTAPKSFGGAGYTAKEMKEAFDRLPLYIISRYNELIDAMASAGDDGAAALIPTGIAEGHSLKDLFSDVGSGALASYLTVLGTPLSDAVGGLGERMLSLESANALSSEAVSEGLAKINAALALAEKDSLTVRELQASFGALVAEINAFRASIEEDIAELGEEISSPSELTIDCGGPSDLLQ